ncbi:GntR family transcriptional regulator [Nannocystis pusilla]|uniref:GntR family transcriptional regulator n=1 Tax=Nannocystis pusilla TaxID=889268 RepID=UPI003B7EE884
MRLKPVARKSLSDAVFEQLSQEIVHGRMRPGAPLPSERALCDVLRVNRGRCVRRSSGCRRRG